MICEHLTNFSSLLNFTIRGIEEHLTHDEPEPEQVAGALEALADLLTVTIKEMEAGQNGSI